MTFTCAVAECKTTTGVRHRFPSDKSVQNAWVGKCRRLDPINISNARICALHFQPEDYERDLRNELLALPLRHLLKKTAIPSIFPARGKVTTTRISNSLAKRKHNEIVKSLTEATTQITDDVESQFLSYQHQSIRHKDASVACNIADSKLKSEISRLRSKIGELKQTIRNLRRRLEPKRNKPKHKNTTFTKAQIKKIQGQKRVNWDTTDIVKALSIRSVSLKAYETARTAFNLPLPATRTLRSWVHRFQCTPGILIDVINILKEHCTSMNPLARLCALSYDEISIDSRYILDPIYDEITTHSKAQVVLARGLVENWKQPIYYDFDAPMTPDTLKLIIVKLEEAGLQVVSITSDLGGENRGVWKSLDIGMEKTWITNPFDPKRKVYFFADIPHMLKLVRNHVLDDGFITPDGVIIDRDVVQALVDADSSELKLCPKLNQKLIDVTGAERMRVRPAAQLLSRHTSTLAKIMFSDSPEIADFIETINDGFDVFNSRCVTNDKNKLLSAYGISLPYQLDTLMKLKDLMMTARCFMKPKNNAAPKPKTSLLPCQIGYVVSINSLVQLYESLQSQFGVRYVITCRLSQDSLESLFSRIRGFGGPNTNPTPPEFRYRFRLILLGGMVRPPKGVNSVDDTSSSYVSANLLAKNELRCTVTSQPEAKENFKKSKRRAAINIASQSSDALVYLAGYIAWKLKRKYPTLPCFGFPTGNMSTRIPSWIQLLSRGGLLQPNKEMNSSILKCNTVFERTMKDSKSVKGMTSYLSELIRTEYPEIRKEIITEFLKVRIKIRINHLNENMKVNNINKKKARQFANAKKNSSYIQ